MAGLIDRDEAKATMRISLIQPTLDPIWTDSPGQTYSPPNELHSPLFNRN